MIATPQQIREGIAANIARTIRGVQVTAYPISNPTPPSCYVESGPTRYDGAMGRGHDDHQFKVVVFVALTSDVAAQQLLDEFAAGTGTRSIKQAVETDRTLAGQVDTLRVTECTGSRVYTFESMTAGTSRPPVLGAEWTVDVIAANKP